MSALLVASQDRDLEAQICDAFDRTQDVSLFVWLPKPRRLYEAFRSPRVTIEGNDVEVVDGYEVELFPVRYSPPTMGWFLRELGVIR